MFDDTVAMLLRKEKVKQKFSLHVRAKFQTKYYRHYTSDVHPGTACYTLLSYLLNPNKESNIHMSPFLPLSQFIP